MKEKYKILITNHSLRKNGGSETYCYALCYELSKRHDVFIYTPNPGSISERMSGFATILDQPAGEFDIILFNHNNTVSDNLSGRCRIYTIHGIFPELEKPVSDMNAYVAVSNEVAAFYSDYSPHVIYNGIDLNIFSNSKGKSRRVRNVLLSSTYKSNFKYKLRLAAWSLGLRFRRIGRSKARKSDVMPDLKWADIVVGLGRTAIEAMAYGKKVIVADKRMYADYGMDGLLTQENVGISIRNNYSGRAFEKKITLLSIRKEIKKAMARKQQKDWAGEWIAKNHDIKNTANQYLEIAKDILSSCPSDK